MRALEAEPVRGKKILDYGCGPADFGLWLATEGADVTLLDLSPAAIEVALKRARASDVTLLLLDQRSHMADHLDVDDFSAFLHVPILQLVTLVLAFGFIGEWYVVGRRIRRLSIERFGEAQGGNMVIGFYAGSRAYLPR
ncbi:MAG: methyltransferase domain-containing protein, partial [Bryobacteraceae bacterium]